MAESGLSIDWAELQIEIGRERGWNTTVAQWSAQNNTDFEYIVQRGLRQFYFPPTPNADTPYYEWSFMRKAGTITLNTNTSAYDLADDATGVVLDQSVTYAAGAGQRRLTKKTEADLRATKAVDNQKGWPKYYAVRVKAHSPTAGQRYEMLVHPTPEADQNNTVIHFRYVYAPETITVTNKYPVGGAQYSDCILYSCLAVAEGRMDDDVQGPYAQKFQEHLGVAIRADTEMKQSGERAGKE